MLGAGMGWRATFFLLGAAGVVYAAVAWWALRDALRIDTTRRPSWSQSMRSLAEAPGFILVAVVFGAGSMAYWMVYTWMPLYLKERFGMGLAGAGFSATFYIQVSSFIAIVAGGWLSDRVRGSRAFVQAIGFLVAGPFLFLTGVASTVPVFIAALVLFGVGRGLYDCNVMPVVCEVVDARLRATAYGILNSIGCIAGGVMAATAGALKSSAGLGGALEVSGVLLVVCAVVLTMLARRMRRAARAVA